MVILRSLTEIFCRIISLQSLFMKHENECRTRPSKNKRHGMERMKGEEECNRTVFHIIDVVAIIISGARLSPQNLH